MAIFGQKKNLVLCPRPCEHKVKVLQSRKEGKHQESIQQHLYDARHTLSTRNEKINTKLNY